MSIDREVSPRRKSSSTIKKDILTEEHPDETPELSTSAPKN